MRKLMYNKYFIVLLILLGTFSLHSQSFFQNALGQWEGDGTLFGMAASFKMSWSQELNGQFYKLEFENRFSDQTGTERVMTAHGYYSPDLSKGQWYDSRGMILPLKMELEGSKLTVLWGSPESEEGKTIYTIESSNRILVEDFVKRNGTYATFGNASYARLDDH